MVLTIDLLHPEEFCDKAARDKISPEQLAEKVVNTYSACLHKLRYSDLKKGYEESGDINLMLAELF